MQLSATRWHCGEAPARCSLRSVGLCLQCRGCKSSFPSLSACRVCTVMPIKRQVQIQIQIIQHSSCLRVRDAGSGQPVSPIKGSAGCEAATRGNDAGILGDAESRLASTHSQRDTHTLMNIHTQQKRHMYCTCMRPSQQWCIDFLQFFDEMSYSDSLPRCYFA